MSYVSKITSRIKAILESWDKIPDVYLATPDIFDTVMAEIENMQYELRHSERGRRSGFLDTNRKGPNQWVNTSQASTFPPYLQEIFNGNGTVKKFNDAVKRRRGTYFTKIYMEAVHRLENGYQNSQGYDTPDREFIKMVKDAENQLRQSGNKSKSRSKVPF